MRKLHILPIRLAFILKLKPSVVMSGRKRPLHTVLIKQWNWNWSHSVVSDSLRPRGLQPTRLLHPWDSPGKNTGVGCHFLLQGIFPTQGSNAGLPHWRQTLKPLSHQGSPNKAVNCCKNFKGQFGTIYPWCFSSVLKKNWPLFVWILLLSHYKSFNIPILYMLAKIILKNSAEQLWHRWKTIIKLW